MEALHERIQEILAKGSKVGKQQSNEAAESIFTLFDETHEEKQVIDLLIQFPPNVTQNFFELVDKRLTQEVIMVISKALITNPRFNENKNDSALYRGFAAAGILLKSGKATFVAAEIISKLLIMVENKGSFTRRCIDLFEENITKICKAEDLSSLKTTWNEFEMKRYDRFIAAIEKRKHDDTKALPDADPAEKLDGSSLYSAESKQCADVLKDILPEKVKGEVIGEVIGEVKVASAAENIESEKPVIKEAFNTREKELFKALHEALVDVTELSGMVKKVKAETSDVLLSISEKHGMIYNLKRALSEKEEEANSLRSEIKDRDEQIDKMQLELSQKERLMNEQLEKNNDLEDRLRESLRMGGIAQNQEVITLKKDIAAALRLEYDDYYEHRAASLDPDVFEAFKASLTRIFRTLKRFGISLE